MTRERHSPLTRIRIMTKKESKQIDITLACLAMAGAKGADKTDMLNALAYDIHLIRKGEDPTEAQKLV